MEPLVTLATFKLKSLLKRQRKGAAVLETVILIVVAVVIVGIIANKFVNGDNSYLNRIFTAIDNIFKLGNSSSTH